MTSCPPEVRKALSRISYGLYIVSAAAGGRKNGLIANAVFQVASAPPRVAASLSKASLTHDLAAESGIYTVSVLAQDSPMPFIGLFGFRSGRDADKFAGTAHKDLAGCPAVTENALAAFAVKVEQAVDAGAHTLFIGRVVAAESFREGEPLTYHHYRTVRGGRTQKNAVTFVAEGPKNDIAGA